MQYNTGEPALSGKSPVSYLRRRTGSVDAAQELLQDLWLRIHTIAAANVLYPVAYLYLYLYRIAGNAAFDWQRRESSLEMHHADAEEGLKVIDDHPSPERLIQSSEAAALLRSAIDELPTKCREAFMLC